MRFGRCGCHLPVLLITSLLVPIQKYPALQTPPLLATQRLNVLRAQFDVPSMSIPTKHRFLLGTLTMVLGSMILSRENIMLLFVQLPDMAMVQCRLLLPKLQVIL